MDHWSSAAALLASLTLGVTTAEANTSHDGWPRITGVLVMNKQDQSRPMDARPGHDLFAGTDPSYSCDGLHKNRSCAHGSGTVARRGHNELLGGHGNDTIAAGGGKDYIKAHYGRGGGADVLYISRRAQKGYKIRHCETISHQTLGY